MSARRTVTITGRPEKRFAAPPPRIERRRPRPRASARLGPRPDRVAMWAVMMALFLILVTVVSAHGAG
jgi:hypothetical protein